MGAVEFGAELRRHVARVGLSQEALARAVGVHQPQVSLWISGKHRPNRAHVRELASALGLGERDSDQLHAAAGMLPADVEQRLLDNADLVFLVRHFHPDWTPTLLAKVHPKEAES